MNLSRIKTINKGQEAFWFITHENDKVPDNVIIHYDTGLVTDTDQNVIGFRDTRD